MIRSSYFYSPENQHLFYFKVEESAELQIYFKDMRKKGDWYFWAIDHVSERGKTKYYHLESAVGHVKALISFPSCPNKNPKLKLKIENSPQENIEVYPLYKMDMRPDLGHDEIPEHPYQLDERQIDALKSHKRMLEHRTFDYRILSYFFHTGYSRQEKITEISNLIEGHAVRKEVVEQGRTGRILAGRF